MEWSGMEMEWNRMEMQWHSDHVVRRLSLIVTRSLPEVMKIYTKYNS